MKENGKEPSARERIVKSYLKLLAGRSPKKATVSAVAKEASCNRDTFYYYFSSIDDVARAATEELVPDAVPHMARALIEGGAPLEIPARARAAMRLVSQIARVHPKMRARLEEALRELWLDELRIDRALITEADEAVLGFMSAGTVGFACEHLSRTETGAAFDGALSTIALVYGRAALGYASERGLLR